MFIEFVFINEELKGVMNHRPLFFVEVTLTIKVQTNFHL
jgi:hypothetical protein